MASLALRTLGFIGSGLIWTLIGILLLVGSALLHLQLPLAKRVVVEWLHGVLQSEIRGDLHIGVLERVGPRGIVARNVVLYDGEGRRVVTAKRVTLDPDMRAASALKVRFGSALLEDGHVWLFDTGDGMPSLLTSFDSRTPGPSSGEPLHVVVDGIELARVGLEGELLGLEGLRAQVDSARGSMDIAGDVHVRIDAARGTVSEPFGFVGHVGSLTGTISTVSTEGVDLRVTGYREHERAQARVRYAAREADALGEGVFKLQVRGDQLSTPTLRALRLDFIPELDVAVSGELDLQGPMSDLAVYADLSSEAGPARVHGSVSDTRGVAIVISSERMNVARLRAGAPELTVAGKLRLDAAAEVDAETRLTLELDPFEYDTWVAPALTMQGALTDDGVRIDGAEAQDRSTRVHVRGDVSFEGAVDLRVRASTADIGSEANLGRLVPDAHGRLDADLHVKTGVIGDRAIHFDGRVTLRDLRYGTLTAARMVLTGSALGDPDHPRLRLDLRGEQVRFADYALGDPGLTVRGGPREYTAEGQFVAAGKRTFNASARITATGKDYLVQADPIEFAVGEGAWRGAVQDLRITPGAQIELGLLRLASRSQRLEARGVLREQGPDQLDAQLQDFDLAAVNALLGGDFWLERGRADAHVTLAGDIAAPDLSIQGALRDGDVGSIKDVNALYFITYRGGHLEADGEVDLGERGIVQLRGTGTLDPRLIDPVEALRRGRYDMELSGQGLACALLPALRDANVSGQVSGTLSFRGTLDQPTFRSALEFEPLLLPGWDDLRVSAQGGYDAGTLSVRASAGDARGPLGSADGQMQLDWAELMSRPDLLASVLTRGPWQVSGSTLERRLDQLPAPLGPRLPYPAVIAAQFELRKQDGETSGQVRWNGFWASAVLDTRCAQDVQLKLRGSATLADESSQFEMVALTGVRRVVTIQGLLDTPVDRWMQQGHVDPPRLFRTSARVDIAQIQRVPYLCEYGNGSLRAELELDGGLSSEPILVAAVSASLYPRMVRQARRKSVRVRSCQGDPIRMQLELNADRDRLRASGGTSGCHGGPIEVRALVPVQWDDLLVLPAPRSDAEIEASVLFDGAQLKPLLDRIPGVKNSDVLANGHVQLSGPISQLRSSGQLGISDGRLYLVATGQELTNIDATLTFRGNWAKLEMLSARQEEGRLTASGGIGFAGIVPQRLRLALHTDALPIKREGVDMAWVTLSAAVDAEITRERTRAAVALHSLTLRLPDTSNRALQPLAPHADVTVVTEKPEPRTLAYPIELVIDGQRRLTVRRNDFEANIATELALAYRDPDLNVGGYIEFSSGEFEVFGKRFEINSGALRFDGSTELNPDVYLIATQRRDAAGTSPVTISVTGTLAEPVVTFSSDVCPGDLGAVTYLVSGRCAADDADVAQDSGDARAAVTSGILSGVLTLGAQRELGGLLPRIAIESGQDEQRLRAGISSESIVPKFMRKLVQRVYVQGGVGVSSQPGDTAEAERAASSGSPLDFLIELYFPHSIVGAGRFAQETWGLDVTWEP